MPQQQLDRPDVGPGLQQMGREAVAQGVDGDVFAQARGAGGLDAGPVHRPGGQGPPLDLAREEPVSGAGGLPIGAEDFQQPGQSMT